ncbi:hypothetical protein CHS0354_026743 [Potamilus streckersoni]|uniref:Large ribosomal subunit protein uL30m n=1 Tax=Potamilus streckersoni TaxID=2493646 RepID=A0AAE0RN71_9BIVA|nr:hypothetical protein CHS0354_026743 [Potamilus streckersoni]
MAAPLLHQLSKWINSGVRYLPPQVSRLSAVRLNSNDVITKDSWMKPLLEMHRKKQEEGPPPDREPTKLLMVKRIKELKGRPYWEKNTMKELCLDGKRFKPVIIKNTEYFCTKLRRVKHLVEIFPVTFPYGLPESEEDYQHCYIRDNGEFMVTKKIMPKIVENITLEETSTVWDIDKETIDKSLKKKLADFDLAKEYFPPQYHYSFNEDGKEYRYSKEPRDPSKKKIWH